MPDPHMNLFYSYNHDNELIENNLTRAFLVTLKHLSPPLRTRLIRRILRVSTSDRGCGNPAESLDFGAAEFALQGHVDRAAVAGARCKCLLSISSAPVFETSSIPQEAYPSIPDGWIVAPHGEYCILIESKVGTNPLDAVQIAAHAREWLRVDDPGEITRVVSWEQISAALADECEDPRATSDSAHERAMLRELLDFLQFYGYRPFRGLKVDGQLDAPGWQLTRRPAVRKDLQPVSLLKSPPAFTIGVH